MAVAGAKIKQGERPKRQKGKPTQDRPVLQAVPPRRKPKTTKQCFENPLIQVDVETGKVLVNRMPEYWAGRRYIDGQDTL